MNQNRTVNSSWRTTLIALIAASLGALGGWALHAPNLVPAIPHDMTRSSSPSTFSSNTPRCRNNAFTDADKLIGAIIEIGKQLPANASQTLRQQLDFMLFVSLKQAQEEVHCVANSLEHGYDKTFANTIRKGIEVAKMRGLSQDVIAIGNQTLQTLEQAKK